MPLAALWRKLPRGAVLLSVITALNVLLGFAREGVVAYFFGASSELDAFLVAYTIPRVVTLHAVQITVSVVLPLYVAHVEAGRPDDATNLLRRWLLFLAKMTTLACIALALFADVFSYLIGPGLTDAQRSDAARWLRMLLPYVWIVIISGCFKVVLDYHRRFFLPAFARVFVIAAVIASCFLGAERFGVGVMVPGLLVGGAVGFLFQWIQSNSYEPKLLSVRELPRSMRLPVMAGGIMVLNAVIQDANIIIDRAFASSLPEGSIAALNYASSIIQVPQTILSAALATALFPILAQMIARGSWRQAYRTTSRWSLVVAGLSLVPVVVFAVWGQEIVALIFQRGEFGAEATEMTASALAVLAFLLVVSGSNSMVLRLLLAQQRHRAVLVTTVLAVAAKILANVLLVGRYGLAGVAAATVLAATLITALRFYAARGDGGAPAESTNHR